MKKEELIKKLEEKIETLKEFRKSFRRLGNKIIADRYFWQIYELEEVLEDIKNLED